MVGWLEVSRQEAGVGEMRVFEECCSFSVLNCRSCGLMRLEMSLGLIIFD